MCKYSGRMPPYNSMCNNCPLYLETCVPIASFDGLALGECGNYLCEGCNENCN